MTREEAVKVIRKMLAYTDLSDRANLKADMVDACHLAIKILEQEPCEDAISRQEVLYLIADYDLSMGQVVKGIHALPSVTPQEPILDKIRAEIAKIPKKYPMTMDYENGLKEAIGIIDKYKAESEE